MKKHELLKYAYDNYPKGTKFKSLLRKDITESTGNFFIDGTGGVAESPTGRAIYFRHKWATIIPESILSGKCAISVNNEREFKLLMEHYEGKGWKWNMGQEPNEYKIMSKYPFEVKYSNHFLIYNGFSRTPIPSDYKIIPFSDFAAEVDIQVPVFVMNSEDGVPLYVGDKYSHAYYSDMPHQWMLGVSKKGLEKDCLGVTKPKEVKVFSNTVNAEKWCDEQNKPKEIVIDYPTIVLTVTKNGFKSVCKSDTRKITYDGDDIEKIYSAYKSLQ